MWEEFCEIYSENNNKPKYRAIYKNDIRYKKMPIFELKGEYFEMIGNEEFRYDKEMVFVDDDWIILKSGNGEYWRILNREERKEYE